VDQREIMQRALGVLTLTYDADESGDYLRTALKSLQEGVFSYEVKVDGDLNEAGAQALKQAMDQVLGQFGWFTAGLLYACSSAGSLRGCSTPFTASHRRTRTTARTPT
jgi:hypothetical protein